MKNLITFCTIVALHILLAGSLHAQNLSEKLGAVQTDFILTSNGEELEIIDQLIAKRAERYYNWNSYNDGAYGYGYGYESFHLEFTARNGEIDLPQNGTFWKNDRPMVLDFYDEDDNLVGSVKRSLREVQLIENNSRNNKLVHYTIDLMHVPLPLLGLTKRIDFYRE